MEQLKHECGVAMIRLRKPLSYFQQKYGTWKYGLNKLYLLMEKQHNRGQEGAGLVSLKLNAPIGKEYFFRERALGNGAIAENFAAINKTIEAFSPNADLTDEYLEESMPFAGEIYMGHLRYSTTGMAGMKYVHPLMRRDNWRAKSLAICGNFNLTNMDEVFEDIASKGQHPRDRSDMLVLLEQLGHRLDREIEHKYRESKANGLTGMDITNDIESRIDITTPLKDCAPLWDGGYVICGVTGSGEMFVTRDPWGIRPAFYYYDDEIVVVASERPVIQTVMNVTADRVTELEPGEALSLGRSGNEVRISQIREPRERKACSFERIYFSRGSDMDIYKERKRLGRQLVPNILEAVGDDLDHSVFSFIPNTAEVAYFGMIDGLEDHLNNIKIKQLQDHKNLSEDELRTILSRRVRFEKVAIKDIKLRTFISEDDTRRDLAQHVYDITYGTIEPGVDNLIVIDDSIVRGTTLKESIISILSRLQPKKIVIVSSSPQIRYPDYYGINMNKMKEFVAFRAAIALHRDRHMEDRLKELYHRTKIAMDTEACFETNFAKEVYTPFTIDELNAKMVELMTPEGITCPVELVFQSIEGLHTAIPDHLGDWYFTGDFPTRGGMRLVNQALINYFEQDYRAIEILTQP